MLPKTLFRRIPRVASTRSFVTLRGRWRGPRHSSDRAMTESALRCGIVEVSRFQGFGIRRPNQLSSDSTWRTLEVRHVGSDTFARGLRCGAAAWLGEEDEGWA